MISLSIFSDEGNQDTVDGNLINFDKSKIVSKRVKDFQQCTRIAYDFPPIESFRDAIAKAEVWDENDIWRLSKLREDKANVEDTLGPSKFDSKSFAKITSSIQKGAQENVNTENIHLSQRDWQLLLSCATTVVFVKNRAIVEEGSMNNTLYRIKEGTVRIEKLLVSHAFSH